MRVDPEYLRRHYASLSDEALMEIDRADLVEVAKNCYDDELAQRHRKSPMRNTEYGNQFVVAPELGPEDIGNLDTPAWVEEGSEVYSAAFLPDVAVARQIESAREALQAEGIPCFVDVYEEPDEGEVSKGPNARWRLLVPGSANFRATRVLERDIFNAEFLDTWKTHMEMLSDEELRAAQPELVFCGLVDRIDRLRRAYQEELSRRGLSGRP